MKTVLCGEIGEIVREIGEVVGEIGEIVGEVGEIVGDIGEVCPTGGAIGEKASRCRCSGSGG